MDSVDECGDAESGRVGLAGRMPAETVHACGTVLPTSLAFKCPFFPADDSDGFELASDLGCSPETVGTGEIGGRSRFFSWARTASRSTRQLCSIARVIVA